MRWFSTGVATLKLTVLTLLGASPAIGNIGSLERLLAGDVATAANRSKVQSWLYIGCWYIDQILIFYFLTIDSNNFRIAIENMGMSVAEYFAWTWLELFDLIDYCLRRALSLELFRMGSCLVELGNWFSSKLLLICRCLETHWTYICSKHFTFILNTVV